MADRVTHNTMSRPVSRTPSPHVSPRGEAAEGDPTNGGCSGNPQAEPLASSRTEAVWRKALRSAVALEAEGDEATGMSAETQSLEWKEKFEKVSAEVQQVMNEKTFRVIDSVWRAKDDARPQECKIVKIVGRGQRIGLYLPDGEGHPTTVKAWKVARTRAELAREKGSEDLLTFPWPWKRALTQALETEYLQTGGLLSFSKWARLFRLLNPDSRQLLWAEFGCRTCGKRRRVGALATESVMTAARNGEDTCEAVGLTCVQPETEKLLGWTGVGRFKDEEDAAFCTLDQGIEPDQLPPPGSTSGKARANRPADNQATTSTNRDLQRSRKSYTQTRSNREFPEGSEYLDYEGDWTDGGEERGYSRAAMRFYKATGKALPLPDFSGVTSEAAFLAWQRGVERHFKTYGVEREEERVGIAVEMLSGEALNWWNGLWMSGRDGDVSTWDELRKKIRSRFLPPEGEMKVVGQWRRLQQTGTVAAYSDYVYKLQAMCSMQQGADFRLAFYGLRPELQGEVRRYMRRREVQTLPLERLFEIATDAELSFGRVKAPREAVGAKEGQFARRPPYATRALETTVQQLDHRANITPSWTREADTNTQMSPSTRSRREPCPVCDEWGHGWMTCTRRRRGKGCARCGSTSHRLATCPRRKKPQGTEDWGGAEQMKDKGEYDPWAEEKNSQGPLIYSLGVSLPCEVPGLPRTRLLTYRVQVGRRPVRAMLDSGATVNVVAQRVLETTGGTIRPSREWVRTADGRLLPAQGMTTIEIEGRGHREKLPCLVLRDLDRDLLLGRPWLQEWNPLVDWTTGDLTFSDGIKWKVWAPRKETRPLGEEKKGGQGRMNERARREVYVQQLQLIPERPSPPFGRWREEVSMDEEYLPDYLEDYRDVFDDPQLPEMERPSVEHRLRLREPVDPIRKVPYRMAPLQKEALREELQKFLKKGWIRPSYSPWATVALVVPKKDKTWRVCIDYRDLNAVTKMDAYPLPKIDELLHRLAQAKIYSKIDLHSGFHQIPVEPASIPLTAFRIPEPISGCSHFEWLVMPMGLSTAPPTFQRWMEHHLRGLESFTLVYLDDVLVFSENGEQHRGHLLHLFQRFRERGMKLKQKKCSFECREIPFLGHWVSAGQIRVDRDKLGRLAEWKPPLKNVREVRQFMGFLSYYRAFIPRFADLTAPLTGLLRKASTWEWTPQATQALTEGKRALIEAQSRHAWHPARPDRVTTDASDEGLGASFEQRIRGIGWAPVAFWSRKLSAAERNYSVTDREWLAVVEAVTRHWRHWLLGRRFIVRTDHSALKQLLRTKGEQFTARQARWAEKLSEFAFELEHIPGPSNAVADALSRSPVECVSALELMVGAPKTLSPEEVEKAAEGDPQYGRRREEIRRGEWDSMRTLDDQGLIRDEQGRVEVPRNEALRIKLILEAHEPPFCGHLGARRTEKRLLQQWTWGQMAHDVEKVIRACDVCQKDVPRGERHKAPLQTIVATKPWEVVTMDFLSGLTPSTPGRWEGCVVVCDRFTRMVHVKECPTHPTAEEAARLFLYLVVGRHGMPTKIITDRGTQFESVLWMEMVKQLGSRVAMATTHHPQTNGLTERANRTLLQMIRRVCGDLGHLWVKWLPLLELAYNSSVHSITRLSPFFANYGYEPRLPASFLCPPPATTSAASHDGTVTAFCRQLQAGAQLVWDQVRRTSEAAGAQAERRENAKRRPPTYHPGEEVLCYQFHLDRGNGGNTRKQQLRFAGPFLVKTVNPHGWVELEGTPPQAPTRYNIEYIRPYRRCLEADGLRSTPPPPAADLTPQGIQWEVEDIVAMRNRRHQREFRVKWKGYSRLTWEPEKHLDGCKQLVNRFLRRT